MDDTTDQIEDAEVVETTSAVKDTLQLETLIKRYLGDLEKLRVQMKSQKEMFEDAFNNDPVYAEQAEKVKQETRKKTEIRQKMVKQPALADLQSKLNYTKDQIKDAQDALSGYLREFYQSTGINQIVGDDGDVREIVIVTKLVKKKSR